MLGDEVVVCDFDGFGEAGCAAAEEARGGGVGDGMQVVEADPVLFTG